MCLLLIQQEIQEKEDGGVIAQTGPLTTNAPCDVQHCFMS